MKSLIKTIACGTLLAGLLVPAIGFSKAIPVETTQVNPIPLQIPSNLLKFNPQLALYISVGGGRRYYRGGYYRPGGCYRVRRCWRNRRGFRRCRWVRRCYGGGGYGGGYYGGPGWW